MLKHLLSLLCLSLCLSSAIVLPFQVLTVSAVGEDDGDIQFGPGGDLPDWLTDYFNRPQTYDDEEIKTSEDYYSTIDGADSVATSFDIESINEETKVLIEQERIIDDDNGSIMKCSDLTHADSYGRSVQQIFTMFMSKYNSHYPANLYAEIFQFTAPIPSFKKGAYAGDGDYIHIFSPYDYAQFYLIHIYNPDSLLFSNWYIMNASDIQFNSLYGFGASKYGEFVYIRSVSDYLFNYGSITEKVNIDEGKLSVNRTGGWIDFSTSFSLNVRDLNNTVHKLNINLGTTNAIYIGDVNPVCIAQQKNIENIVQNQTDKINNSIKEEAEKDREHQSGLFAGLMDFIKGFFLPSDEEMGDIFTDLGEKFEKQFGFLYTVFDIPIRLFDTIINSSADGTIENLPVIFGKSNETWTLDLTFVEKNMLPLWMLFRFIVDIALTWSIIQYLIHFIKRIWRGS